MGFPGGSEDKASACNVGDPGSIPDQEDPPEKGMATTLVSLPREFHGQRSLAGYSPWGCKESDTTEQLNCSFFHLGKLLRILLRTLSFHRPG